MAEDKVSLTFEVSGLDEMIDAMKAIRKGPSFKTIAKFESHLDKAFAVTQANVHVISGRLKASGHTESDWKSNVWTGQINYGGPSGSPAYYGVYELHRHGNRQQPPFTPHDFFFGLGDQYDLAFEGTIDEWFKEIL